MIVSFHAGLLINVFRQSFSMVYPRGQRPNINASFLDVLGDLDAPSAGVVAVEGGSAASDPLGIVSICQSVLFGSVVGGLC
jgi:hypothetical protein